MTLDSTTIMVAVNIIVTLGGVVRLWVSFEHRMTKIETDIHHVMKQFPKRQGDTR